MRGRTVPSGSLRILREGPVVGSRRASIAQAAGVPQAVAGVRNLRTDEFLVAAHVPPGREDAALEFMTKRLRTADDPQRDRVYAWERNYVEPAAKEMLSRDGCATMVASAARTLRITVPELRFTKRRLPCLAIPGEWAIRIADWGRERVTLLHETAHLATAEAVASGAEAPHGAAFVRTAIDLYAAFTPLSAAVLERTAKGMGIEMAPSSQSQEAAETGDAFFEEDF